MPIKAGTISVVVIVASFLGWQSSGEGCRPDALQGMF
jgi:hypothetical protein